MRLQLWKPETSSVCKVGCSADFTCFRIISEEEKTFTLTNTDNFLLQTEDNKSYLIMLNSGCVKRIQSMTSNDLFPLYKCFYI